MLFSFPKGFPILSHSFDGCLTTLWLCLGQVQNNQDTFIYFQQSTPIPYCTKIRRTKFSKFRLGVENIVRPKILSVEHFAHYFNTEVRKNWTKLSKLKILSYEIFCSTKILSDEFLSDRVSQKKEKVFEIESFNWLHRSFSLFMQQATKALVIRVMFLLCYFCPKYYKNIKCTK